MNKPKMTPGPDHPITIAATGARVVVRAGGHVIVDTRNALTLTEASIPPVQYVPLSELDPAVLRASDTETYCPFKGEASYYSIVTGDTEVKDAVWTYKAPFDAVDEIAGHAAFYADRVEISVGEG